jgi:hypothetical protein
MHRAVFDKKHKELKDTSVSEPLPLRSPNTDAYDCSVRPILRQATLEMVVHQRVCAHWPLEDAVWYIARRERWEEGSGLWSAHDLAASRFRTIGT